MVVSVRAKFTQIQLFGPILLIWLLASAAPVMTRTAPAFNPCNKAAHTLWVPYSGYKIQLQITMAPKPGQSLLRSLLSNEFDLLSNPLQQVVITKCERGFVQYEAAEAITSDTIVSNENVTETITEGRFSKIRDMKNKINSRFKASRPTQIWKMMLEMATENIWNRTICTIREPTLYESKLNWSVLNSFTNDARLPATDERVCFRLARRYNYIPALVENLNDNSSKVRETSKRVKLRTVTPGALVGALFECISKPFNYLYTTNDDEYKKLACTPRTVRPVLPLIADEQLFYKSKTQINNVSGRYSVITVRVPLFYTPDLMDRQYPRLNTEWAVPPGAKALSIPHYVKHYYLDRNWARSIDPFEEFFKKKQRNEM